MYHDNKLMYKFNIEKPIHALRFGLYGREDNTLVIVHGRGGAVTIKIMRRSVSSGAAVVLGRGEGLCCPSCVFSP